jgi:tRNA A37 threonylcarbamoyladenosine modification protein TsaB
VYQRPIAVVSRLEAVAAQGSRSSEPYVAAFADARRNQVFGALYTRRGNTVQRVGDEVVIAPEKFVALAVEFASGALIQWISTEPQSLAETAAWSARRSLGETIETVSPVLAPVIGRLGYQLALKNQLTDALALDANYVRRSDAEIFWKDRR